MLGHSRYDYYHNYCYCQYHTIILLLYKHPTTISTLLHTSTLLQIPAAMQASDVSYSYSYFYSYSYSDSTTPTPTPTPNPTPRTGPDLFGPIPDPRKSKKRNKTYARAGLGHGIAMASPWQCHGNAMAIRFTDRSSDRNSMPVQKMQCLCSRSSVPDLSGEGPRLQME